MSDSIEREKAFAYWLVTAAGLPRNQMQTLYQHCKTAESVYYASEKRLQSILHQNEVDAVMAHKAQWNVWEQYELLQQKKIEITVAGDGRYPEKLRTLPDAPIALFYKGKLPDGQRKTVAIVGARNCSDYGSITAKKFGAELAGYGIPVVSGMAMGIDGIAQMAAIRKGGDSFGVLGCGVDICYPARNRALYDALTEHGGILSEYPPGMMPKQYMFPARNRIISGLSDLVLVIQAGTKSGTLITADMALEQGRDVMAVPGRLWDSLSAGCLNLIKQGAGMATCVEDILEALSISGGGGAECYEQMTLFSVETLTPEEQILWNHMSMEPVSLEYLSETCRVPLEQTMNLVISLCVKGYAEPKSSGTYRISEKMFLQGKKK